MMKLLGYLLFSFSTLLAFNCSSSEIAKINRVETKVKTGTSEFSLYIELVPDKEITTDWALGFYMPRTFDQLINKSEPKSSINPDLKMSISDGKNNISELKYLISKSSLSFSAGYTSVIAPAENYTLHKGNTYQIKLENNNQWGPGNFSSMPQSFFIVTGLESEFSENTEINPISTNPNLYIFGGYDQAETDSEINEHLRSNMSSSAKINNPADELGIVPSPVKISKSESGVNLTSAINVSSDNQDQDKNLIDAIKAAIESDIHIEPLRNKDGKIIKKYNISLKKINNPEEINNDPEGYKLKVKNGAIEIEGLNETGRYYGFQTLRFLWNKYKGKLPGLEITDYPRFKYRGVLLDVARHFSTVDEIKQVIDAMAAMKLNTLHLHLSDDEGWRIKFDELEKLVNGSKRGFAKDGHLTPVMFQQANLDKSNYFDFYGMDHEIVEEDYPEANNLYSGIYSVEDIKEIISYANKNQITVIPEIDLPGHARALVYSIPEVFIDPNDKSQYISVQGYSDDVIPVPLYNSEELAGSRFTDTINRVVVYISKLFSGQKTVYAMDSEISVGGDEVAAGAWSNDLSATGEWKDKNALEKSHYFFRLLQKGTGVKMSGWQQFVQNDDGTLNSAINVPANSCGRVWVWEPTSDGIDQAVQLANANYPIVLAFADTTYFDLTYSPDKWEPGFSWAGKFLDTNSALKSASTSLETIGKIEKDKQNKVLGLEGTLWSENLTNFRHLQYMAFPKMTGLAEAAWAPTELTVQGDNKINWSSLVSRLGKDNNGYLGYLNKTFGMFYRGYPKGISNELSTD